MEGQENDCMCHDEMVYEHMDGESANACPNGGSVEP